MARFRADPPLTRDQYNRLAYLAANDPQSYIAEYRALQPNHYEAWYEAQEDQFRLGRMADTGARRHAATGNRIFNYQQKGWKDLGRSGGELAKGLQDGDWRRVARGGVPLAGYFGGGAISGAASVFGGAPDYGYQGGYGYPGQAVTSLPPLPAAGGGGGAAALPPLPGPGVAGGAGYPGAPSAAPAGGTDLLSEAQEAFIKLIADRANAAKKAGDPNYADYKKDIDYLLAGDTTDYDDLRRRIKTVAKEVGGELGRPHGSLSGLNALIAQDIEKIKSGASRSAAPATKGAGAAATAGTGKEDYNNFLAAVGLPADTPESDERVKAAIKKYAPSVSEFSYKALGEAAKISTAAAGAAPAAPAVAPAAPAAAAAPATPAATAAGGLTEAQTEFLASLEAAALLGKGEYKARAAEFVAAVKDEKTSPLVDREIIELAANEFGGKLGIDPKNLPKLSDQILAVSEDPSKLGAATPSPGGAKPLSPEWTLVR